MKLLSFCTAVLLLITKINADDDKSQWEKQIIDKLERFCEECAKITNATEETIQAARDRTYPNEPLFKKLILCLTQKTGMLDQNGMPVCDDIRRKLEKVPNITDDRVEEIMAKCVVDKGEAAETAYYVAKCMEDEAPLFVPVEIEDPVTEEIDEPVTEIPENPVTEEIEDPVTEEIEDPVTDKVEDSVDKPKDDWDQSIHDRLELYAKKCAKDTNLPPKLVEQGKKFEWPEDPLFYEYMLCLAKATDTMNENGKFNKDIIERRLKKTGITDAKVKEIMDKCLVDLGMGKAAETAFKGAHCLHLNSKYVPLD